MKYKISRYIIKITEEESGVILFNAISGEVVKLKRKLYESLCTGEFDETIEFFNELLQKRVIVPKAQDEFGFLRYNEIVAQNTTKQTVLSYVIAPTYACNLRCVYCFEGNEHPNVTMDDQTVESVVAFVKKQLIEVGTIEELNVTWFGGEPLLCLDTLLVLGQKLKDLAKETNVKFESSIVTNGVLFTKQVATRLIEFCNLKSAQITIDGTLENYCKKKNATKEDYDRVIKNIQDVCDDIEIDVRLNTDKENRKDMYDLVDFFFSDDRLRKTLKLHMAQLINYTGVKSEQFLSYDEYRKEADCFIDYIEKKGLPLKNSKKTLPCHKLVQCRLATKNNYAVGPKGELYKCEQHIGQADKEVGSVARGLYYNSTYFASLIGVNDQKCKECELYPVCNHYARCPQLHASISKDEQCEIFTPLMRMLKKSVLESIK